MKTNNRSRFITALTVSVGLVAALLAGGCAVEADEADAGVAPVEAAVEGDEGSSEAAAADDAAGEVHVASHPAGCRCGICTGGRHVHEVRLVEKRARARRATLGRAWARALGGARGRT